MTSAAELVVYCDSSALARAYLADEPGHAELRERLLTGEELVVTSALTSTAITRCC